MTPGSRAALLAAALLAAALIVTGVAVPPSARAQSIAPLERAAGTCIEYTMDGWSVQQPSPDVIVGNGVWPGGGWVVSEAQGGTAEGSVMQLMLSGGSFRESISTTATGLTAGVTYAIIVWYQGVTNTYSGVGTFANGDLRVTVDGVAFDFIGTAHGDAWTRALLTFTASGPTATVVLAITHLGDGSLGGAVVADGISIDMVCDVDDDGYDGPSCGGTDCDDEDETIYDGADETWYDGVDQDCDGWSDYDQDFDGYDSDAHGGEDCDDEDDTQSPDATEVFYDGVDQDCDGWSDYDQDFDGYDSDAHGGEDCDDEDDTTYPDAPELDDDIDNNCNGLTEDDDTDGDGITDEDELLIGTDPDDPDSDGDGVSDGDEVGDDHNNPRDTNDDGIIDALDANVGPADAGDDAGAADAGGDSGTDTASEDDGTLQDVGPPDLEPDAGGPGIDPDSEVATNAESSDAGCGCVAGSRSGSGITWMALGLLLAGLRATTFRARRRARRLDRAVVRAFPHRSTGGGAAPKLRGLGLDGYMAAPGDDL